MDIELSELIDAVKNYPQLYDAGRNDFKIPERKQIAWTLIAQTLATTIEDCKKRWRTVRERYTRELKRLKFSGMDDTEKRISKWEYFDSMSFLYEHIKYRRVTKNKNEPGNGTDDPLRDSALWAIKAEGSAVEDNFEENEANENQEESYYVEAIDNSFPENTIKEPTKKNRKRTSEEVPNRNDEDDFFCNSVACTLRKLSRLHNIKAKVEIFKVLESFIEKEEDNIQE